MSEYKGGSFPDGRDHGSYGKIVGSLPKPKFKFELRPEDNKEITESFRGTVEKHMNDAMVKRWEMVESLMLLYMAGTGFRPDQLELVEEWTGTKTVWTIRPILRPGSETKITEEGKADPCHVRLLPSHQT